MQYARDENCDDEDYDDEGDDEVFETMDDAPMKIEPHLYLGSFMAEQNAESLKKEGVTHVLQVCRLDCSLGLSQNQQPHG